MYKVVINLLLLATATALLQTSSAHAGFLAIGRMDEKIAFLNQVLPEALSQDHQALVPGSMKFTYSKLFSAAKILDKFSILTNLVDPDVRVVAFKSTDETGKLWEGWVYLWTFKGKIPADLQDFKDFVNFGPRAVFQASSETAPGSEHYMVFDLGKKGFHFKPANQ